MPQPPDALQPLPAAFFERDTLVVARDLLGRHLLMAGVGRYRIVETEAYTQADPACHAHKRKTGRSAIMYQRPGLAYVYFTYGMHHCMNIVTEPDGVAGAVLLRALEPLDQQGDPLTAVLPKSAADHHRTYGPGRLTKALGITTTVHNGLDLTQSNSPMRVLTGRPVSDNQLVQTTRIGISQAKDYPWRFYIRDNVWVSVK